MNTITNAILWALISGGLSVYLHSINWSILGYIAGIFCAMCLYTLFNIFWLGYKGKKLYDETDPYKENGDPNILLECQYCGEYLKSSDYFNANNKPESKLFMAEIYRTKEDGADIGLNIYPLLCFECNFVTEYASDFQNVSGNAKKGYEYFGSFKLNNEYKSKLLDYAVSIDNDVMKEKIKKIII